MPSFEVFNQSCESLPFEDNSVDALVTDPPYEISFTGHAFDSTGIAYSIKMWREMLRVLKPGAYILVFGHPRKIHRVVCAIEDAGFTIQDTLAWVYGSALNTGKAVGREVDRLLGKPRNNDRKTYVAIKNLELFRKQLNGEEPFEWDVPTTELGALYNDYNTTLKPGYEPICLAQKPPSESTYAGNLIRWGVGALNIGETRIAYRRIFPRIQPKAAEHESNDVYVPNANGRHPRNIIVDKFAADLLDIQQKEDFGIDTASEFIMVIKEEHIDMQSMRFYYADKPTRAEKGAGCEELTQHKEIQIYEKGFAGVSKNPNKIGNNHPTVKPISLMRYLIKLVTAEGQTVLDPFMGSGSTGCAAMLENRNFIGVELDAGYAEIAKNRLNHWIMFEDRVTKEPEDQITFF